MSKLVINALDKKSKISKEIYGNFSEHLGRCIYNGIYVGENSSIPNVKGMRTDIVEALKEMKLPVLRWPGGCFADEYHWKDGIGDKSKRKKMINTHWGGVVEDNSFGTHEFMELCEQIGCEPYVNGNVGSGTVQEMSEWVEYMTFGGESPMSKLRAENGHAEAWKLKYFGVGNENWGCGGSMTPEYYANEYRRYQTYVRNYDGNRIYKIACGPNVDDYKWMETLVRNAGWMMDGISLHYYTVPGDWGHKSSATVFDVPLWYKTLSKTLYMDELVTKHAAIIQQGARKNRRKIGLIVDEWGTWYDVEPGTNPGFLYQQNSVRDALVAGINLDIFNTHSDVVTMANIAQLINVLQSVILTDGEKMLLTPTYHVFNMYKYHQDATLIGSFVETEEIGVEKEFMVPNLHQSASIADDGTVTLTMSNLSAEQTYSIDGIVNGIEPKSVEAEILTGAINDHNTFENPDKVHPVPFNVDVTANGIKFDIPPCSVIRISLK